MEMAVPSPQNANTGHLSQPQFGTRQVLPPGETGVCLVSILPQLPETRQAASLRESDASLGVGHRKIALRSSTRTMPFMDGWPRLARPSLRGYSGRGKHVVSC